MNDRLEGLRAQWEALTDREKRAMRIMGAVGVLLMLMVPVYMLSNAIADVHRQNDALLSVLADIDRAEVRLAQREAERQAAEARYNQRAPELGTFLEGRSRDRRMTIASVTNQPEVQQGRYRKRHVRANFPGTDLRNAMRLLADVENAPYPIALERVHIEHFQEGDHFNLEIGVITYDREATGGRDGGVPSAGSANPSGRAGPPAP